MKKLLFFDIDGTLWDNRSRIPESTVRAIRRARENGHLAFINSGRSRGYIRAPHLFDIGFDGIVSGDGTMIELPGPGESVCHPRISRNRVCSYYEIPPEETCEIISLLKRHRFCSILEGRDYLYIDKEDFGDDAYIRHIEEDMGADLLPMTGGELPVITKFSCDLRHAVDIDEGLRKIGERFDAIRHTDMVIEFVPKGFTKATGIEDVCRLLGASPEDTVAFGDGANDVPMLEYAGYGYAMANACREALACTPLVAPANTEDGVAQVIERCLREGRIGPMAR